MSLDEHVNRLAEHQSSLSDVASYREVCIRAATDDTAFATFRLDPAYRRILEHVTYAQGLMYIEEIKRLEPALFNITWTESIGSPVMYSYAETGPISPTMLRYVKVAAELRKLFGPLDNQHVVEIGGGYGGQARVLKMLHPTMRYSIIDLEDVLPLINRFLERSSVDDFELIAAESDWWKSFVFKGDLFLSNYAVTECAPALHRRYLERVAAFMSRGYITGNAQEEATFAILRAKLGEVWPLRRLEETPKLVSDNFVCVWGHPFLVTP